MSAQSIKDVESMNVSDNIDKFLMCEGNAFRNIIDYDLDMKIDYDELRKILYLRDMMKRTNNCEQLTLIIDKILK